MIKNFIGIDNGVSGSIGIISDSSSLYVKTPIKRELNYTKSKQFLNRVDFDALKRLLFMYSEDSFCLIERPMINPGRWKATVSAIRALESTLNVIELLKIPFSYIDSKEWQKALLPSGLEKQELKFASLNVGERLYPNINLSSFDDCDGLLLAHYCKMTREK
jgi:hypothetical protein